MIKLTIKKLFRNKVNITMIIIFAICSLTLTGALMFEKNYIQMQKDDFDKNVDGRTLLVREKRNHILSVICGWAILFVLVGWAGVSGYNKYESSRPIETVYVNLDSLNSYVASLSATE